MEKGAISVQSQNIFPIIKKFLYADHDIFLRELISNAIDASQKLKTLVNKGVVKSELGDLTIEVGPDAGSPRNAIGEVLLRQIDGPAVGGPPMQAYSAMQPLAVDGGWRATFYLDAPLGREIKLGQYLVLAVAAENSAQERRRVTLPLIAKMGGTMPNTPR